MKYDPWPTREERARMRAEIAEAGGVRNWLKRAGEKPALTTAERLRKQAANKVADEHGFPRPYPDLDSYPSKEERR